MTEARRPIKARGAAWARNLAASLAKRGVTPNQISVLSAVFSLMSMLFFINPNGPVQMNYPLSLFLGALFIQLRLICNLMDGMVAMEHKQKTKSGEVYNDAPDRFADLFILVGVGYSLGSLPFAIELGYLAGAIAIFTAYVRLLGASMGVGHFFLGPMAKQHRMAVITIGALIDCALSFSGMGIGALYIALVITVVGGAFTVLRRLVKIVKEVEK